jgi:hypothetical protein
MTQVKLPDRDDAMKPPSELPSAPGIAATITLLLGAGLCGVGLLSAYSLVLVSLVVLGIAVSLVQPTLIGAALDGGSENARGRVAGWMASVMFAGQFVSPLLSAPIEARADLSTAFGIVGLVCAAVGALFLAAMPWRKAARTAGLPAPSAVTVK